MIAEGAPAPFGAEALRLVASAPPDVMVLDLVMPEMEGLTVPVDGRGAFSIRSGGSHGEGRE